MTDPDLYVCDCARHGCTGFYKRVHADLDHVTVDGVELRDVTVRQWAARERGEVA